MARNEDSGATYGVTSEVFGKLVKAHPEFDVFAGEWRWKDKNKDCIKIPSRRFSRDAFQTLLNIYRNSGDASDRWIIGQLRALIAVIDNPEGERISQLRPLELALLEWLRKDVINCWIFARVDDLLQPVLVSNVWYTPPKTDRDGSYIPSYVTLLGVYWEKGSECSFRLTWYQKDLRGGKTLKQVTTDLHDIYHESPELVATYVEDETRFLEWRKLLGEQFVGNGKFSTSTRRNRYNDEHDTNMQSTRLIVDDRCDAIETLHPSTLFTKNIVVGDDDDDSQSDTTVEDDNGDEYYNRMPVNFYIWCFNLTSYRGGFVHMDDIVPYEYKPELREKLILPPAHADLIDALTSDMHILMEDIITGKTGGTCILCQGKAGTGKTLTAEIYAEIMKRPLYKIHSGQLGTDSGSVETGLKTALDNATKWRAVLLIDEADVFISQRDNDLEKNAVVGVFLRTLEYYSGVLFLTTNRADVIDDAILSRCIAWIKYDVPTETERVKLWLTLGGVYGLQLVSSKGMAERLAKRFESTTGRDIKGLIRLVTKYASNAKRSPTFADFERLAVFKGL